MVRKKNTVLVKISINVISTVTLFLLLHVQNPANSSVNGGIVFEKIQSHC